MLEKKKQFEEEGSTLYRAILSTVRGYTRTPPNGYDLLFNGRGGGKKKREHILTARVNERPIFYII